MCYTLGNRRALFVKRRLKKAVKELAMSRRKYDTLGVMLDLSRNAVMSVPSLKEHMKYLQKMQR